MHLQIATCYFDVFQILIEIAFKFKITPVGWISVDTSDGDEWVVLWADEEITAPDGSIDSHYAHEGFKIKDGKIITVNQYYRPKLK